VFPQLSPQVL